MSKQDAKKRLSELRGMLPFGEIVIPTKAKTKTQNVVVTEMLKLPRPKQLVH